MANVHSLSHTCNILVLHNHQNQLYCRTQQLYFQNLTSTHFNTLFLSSPSHVCKSNLRDSNADSYTFTSNPQTEKEDFDVGLAVFDEYIHSIWIFKVFGSYGWMSPVILISWLIATGLKAFLITLAIPILQSTFTFAFQKMQGEIKTSPEFKTKKTKKRTTSRSHGSTSVKTREPSVGGNEYGSWYSETNGFLNRNEGSVAEFGGWDELDAGAPPKRPRRSRKSSGVRGSPGKKSRLRGGWNSNDTTPMLLRLLISLFPFLEFLE